MILKIGVVGCGGRMGRMLLRQVAGINALIGGTVRPESPEIGRDLGALAGIEPLGIQVTADPAALFASADVVIDFTNPTATASHATLAATAGTALVVGTTGLGPDHQAALDHAATRVAIVQAANTSAGITLLQAVVEQLARALDPDDFDIEILEMHHRHKVDAPSGTALALGRAAARGRGVDLDTVEDRGRDGLTGPRIPGHIGFAVLRGGDVVGEHTVSFAGPGERLEITHKAGDRSLFARGAVRAARWVAGKPPGLYGMTDVLGLSRNP